MRKINLIILLIIITFSFTGCTSANKNYVNKNTAASSKQLTQNEKLADFEYMYKILKENYPYFDVNKRLNGVDWLANKNDYISKIKATTDDYSFFNTMNAILSDLHNGHTCMMSKSFYTSTKNVYEKYSKISNAWLNQLNNPKTVKRYASMPDKKSNSTISSGNIIAHNVTIKNIEKGKTAYIKINSLNSFNINGDMQIIKPYLQSIKDYKVLIIDIRGNTGGDSTYWSDNIVPMLINKPLDDKQYIAYRGGGFVEQFIKNRMKYGYEKMNPISDIYKEKLKNLPPELKDTFKYYWENVAHYEPKASIGFKGKIYLLVDGCVFSSSEAFATFAKSTGFAILVGEKTGGDGLGDGPAVCALPNSGYIFEFTKEMGLVSDGACNFENKTEPDIKVSAKYESNISNDEAIQTVLKLVN